MRTFVMSNISKDSFLGLALFAAVFLALGKVGDSAVLNNGFSVPQDKMTSSFAFLIVGSWIGSILGFPFAFIAGKRFIDKDFSGLELKSVLFHKWALISGLFGAIFTFFYLWGFLISDPSVVTALLGATILFLAGYEVKRGKITIRDFLLPAFLVLIGNLMASYTGNGKFTFFSILIVGVLASLFNACSKLAFQKGASIDRKPDPVNFMVWRFVWFAIVATPLAFLVSAIFGNVSLLLQLIQEGFFKIGWAIIILMFVVFIGEGVSNFLLTKNAASSVILATSIHIPFSYPFTFLGEAIKPGLYGTPLINDQIVWIVRIIGAIFIAAGIYWLELQRSKENLKVVKI